MVAMSTNIEELKAAKANLYARQDLYREGIAEAEKEIKKLNQRIFEIEKERGGVSMLEKLRRSIMQAQEELQDICDWTYGENRAVVQITVTVKDQPIGL